MRHTGQIIREQKGVIYQVTNSPLLQSMHLPPVACHCGRLLLQRLVAGAVLKVSVVRRNVRAQVHNLARVQHARALQHHGLAFVILAFVVPGEPAARNVLAALGRVIGGHFFLGEDGLVRALGNARAAVNAGVRVNVEPRPLAAGFARNDAFHRAHLHA